MTGSHAAAAVESPAERGLPRPASSRTAWVVGVVAGTVLAGAIPAYLVAFVEDSGRSDAWPLTCAVLVWAGVRLAILVGRGEPRLFELFFWLYVYIFMGLAPTVQMRSNQLPGTTPGMDPALDLATAGLVVLGLIAFEIGRAVGRLGRSATGVSEGMSTLGARISTARTAVLFLVGAAAATYYLSRVGVGDYFSSRDDARVARIAVFPNSTTRATLAGVGLYPLLVAVGALVQVRRRVATDAARRLATLALVTGMALVLLQASPVSNARYTVGTVFFALAVFLGATRTTVRARATMIATIVGFLFVFPLADAFRRTGGGNFVRRGFFGEYGRNGDYDSIWQIANAYSYWQDDVAQPFRQLTGSLLFWVPRSVWSGKPTDTGILLADYRHYSFENLSAPLWAEALVNGGVGLLVVVFVMLGWGLRRLDTKLVASMGAGGPWVLLGGIFPVYLTILLRGSLLQATGAFALAVAALLFISVRTRPPIPVPLRTGARARRDSDHPAPSS
jgi:hypothetical protein